MNGITGTYFKERFTTIILQYTGVMCTDAVENHDCDETDQRSRNGRDNLGKLVDHFIRINKQDRQKNGSVHDDAKHDSQHTADLYINNTMFNYNHIPHTQLSTHTRQPAHSRPIHKHHNL